MCSDNASGAVNQQERLDAYIAGYVDGEGSFHVAVQRNPSTRAGWQLVPEFHVSQNPERRQVLDLIRHRLGCGRIRENDRRRPTDTSLVFVVRQRNDLLEKVVPFFEATAPSEHQAGGLPRLRSYRARDGERRTPELRRVSISDDAGPLHEWRWPVSSSASDEGIGILRDHTPNTARLIDEW